MKRITRKWLETAGFLVLLVVTGAAAEVQTTTPGTCLVIVSTTLVDNQPCTREIATHINVEGRRQETRTHVWPTGSRTILEMDQELVLLNGEEAVPVGGTMGLSCFFNRTTSRVFCFFEDP